MYSHMSENTIESLDKFAKKIRYYTLKQFVNMGFGHYGGSLSIVEALAVIYGKHLNSTPENAKDVTRDYFVLSKGHAGPALYATLYLKGFFTEEWLLTLNNNGTRLPSHPDRNLTPGVDMTTGSLGQGISAATGIALGNKIAGRDNTTYVIVGDGELNEGQVWEAIQMASHNKLDHLIIFVDDNKMQLDGPTKDISEPHDYVQKFESFGCYSERIDGHSIQAIDEAIQRAQSHKNKPSVIVLDTVKGYGVKVLEEMSNNHHVRPDEKTTEAITREFITLGQSIGVLE